MVEKVFISPNRVRAYGNIVNMKTGDDFTLVNSELTVTTDTVDGAEMTVFQFEVEGGISIALTSSSSTCNVGDNVLLTATVMDNNTPVEAAEVTFKVGETVLGTDETDANGVATYTYTTSSAGSLSFSASYQDSTSSVVSVSVNHSYSLSFSQSSYVATGGSATLECTLLEDNVALSGASVTVTGSDGSVYNGITNSSGIASVTVSNISAETTFTCSYQGVTDTCTVTVSSYLFYDDCSSDRSSEYSRITSRGNATITYSSDGYYILKESSSNDDCGFLIPSVVVGSNVRISAKVNHQTSGNLQSGVGFYNNSTSRSWCGRIVRINNTVSLNREYGDSSQGSTSLTTRNNVWYIIEMEYTNDSAMSFNVYSNDGTLLKSITGSQSDLSTSNNSPYIRLSRVSNSTIWVKDIKVEAL